MVAFGDALFDGVVGLVDDVEEAFGADAGLGGDEFGEEEEGLESPGDVGFCGGGVGHCVHEGAPVVWIP